MSDYTTYVFESPSRIEIFEQIRQEEAKADKGMYSRFFVDYDMPMGLWRGRLDIGAKPMEVAECTGMTCKQIL
jgi:hypothetical protein